MTTESICWWWDTYLALDNRIDISKTSETAASHSDALVPDNDDRVLDGKQRDDTKECKFWSFNNPMKKDKCPARGKFAISVERLITSRANATRLLINQLGLCLGWKGQWIRCVTRGREGGGGEGREGGNGEGRDDCYTYYSDGTIYTDQQWITIFI